MKGHIGYVSETRITRFNACLTHGLLYTIYVISKTMPHRDARFTASKL